MRLIAQKDSTHKHKIELQSSKSARYGLHYTPDPKRSFLIEPGRQLNYKLARTNLTKFKDEFIDQKIRTVKFQNGQISESTKARMYS